MLFESLVVEHKSQRTQKVKSKSISVNFFIKKLRYCLRLHVASELYHYKNFSSIIRQFL